MQQRSQFVRWRLVSLVAVATLVCVRYVAVIDAGAGHGATLRTHAFWALVCVPVAMLADLVGRTIADYRVVQLAVARVRSRR